MVKEVEDEKGETKKLDLGFRAGSNFSERMEIISKFLDVDSMKNIGFIHIHKIMVIISTINIFMFVNISLSILHVILEIFSSDSRRRLPVCTLVTYFCS